MKEERDINENIKGSSKKRQSERKKKEKLTDTGQRRKNNRGQSKVNHFEASKKSFGSQGGEGTVRESLQSSQGVVVCAPGRATSTGECVCERVEKKSLC